MIKEKKETLIITFLCTTDAIQTEKFCARNHLPGRMIPVPRAISASCGLAWKAAPEEKELLLEAMRCEGLRWEGIYLLML